MKNRNSSSYLMLTVSVLIFGTIGLFRRYIPLSSGILACARGFMGSAVILIFMKATGRKLCHGIGLKKVLLLALTGALMGYNWIFLFEAYNYTTVAVTTLCYYMQPTIVVLLSPLVFGEKLNLRKILCVIFSVAGMVLVSGLADGGAGGASLTGVLLGLAAAALYSSVIILNKKVDVEDSYEKTVIQLFSAAAAILPYLLLTEDLSAVTLTPFSGIMLLVVGIVHTGIAYVLYFGSMPALPAQSIAILSYIDPVFALILSAAVLGEKMSFFGILGAVLIIGSALVSELKKD